MQGIYRHQVPKDTNYAPSTLNLACFTDVLLELLRQHSIHRLFRILYNSMKRGGSRIGELCKLLVIKTFKTTGASFCRCLTFRRQEEVESDDEI